MHQETVIDRCLIFLLKWIKENRQAFQGIVWTAAIVLVVGIFISYRFFAMKNRAEEKLLTAQSQIYRKQFDESLKSLSEIIAMYPKTAAGTRARLIETSILIQQKKYAEAEKVAVPLLLVAAAGTGRSFPPSQAGSIPTLLTRKAFSVEV